MDDNKSDSIIDEILSLIENKSYTTVARKLEELTSADAAEVLDTIPPFAIPIVFRLIHKDAAADIFADLSIETQTLIIEKASDLEAASIIESQMTDDAVDTLGELPANVVRKILKSVSPETRKIINQFLSYPENSVGSVMTSEYLDLKETINVEKAISQIRKEASEVEQVHTCYVIDEKRVLIGVVTIRDLLLSPDDVSVGSIMEKDVISLNTNDDRQEAASQMQKYDLLSMPVVDAENRLVGLVTIDDILDVVEEETTEDIEKMAGIISQGTPYLELGVFKIARNRFVWLLFLMFSSILAGLVISDNTEVFKFLPILVAFMPMITDTCGNAGSQTASTIIRALATDNIGKKDFLRVLWKEIRIALLAGFALAMCNELRILIQYNSQFDYYLTLANVVSITLVIAVLLSKILGVCLPYLATLLKIDPALMAGPLITTIMDSLSLVVYFRVCMLLFKI